MSQNIYQPAAQDSLSLQELEFWHEIADYRAERGLDPVPLSRALTTTAGRHVVDTRENIWGEDLELPDGANLHSWSDRFYYADGRDPEAMWFAPDRLGTGYTAPAYEITAAGTASTGDTLDLWQDSPAHDAILANSGSWADNEFRAMGIGVDTSRGPGPYAGRIHHVWFAEEPDSSGSPRIQGSRDDDEIVATPFVDRIFAASGEDAIRGATGDDQIWGGNDDDEIAGGRGDDRLVGEAGEDLLLGGPGRDRLYGSSGDDALRGGRGDDRLVGGAGADLLTGDAGSDTFVFRSDDVGQNGERDAVTDFRSARDRLELTDFGGLDFIGGAEFSRDAGELRFGSELVQGDLDGDGSVDFEIALNDVGALAEDDLLL